MITPTATGAPQRSRRGLGIALAATLAATAWLMLQDEPGDAVVGAADARRIGPAAARPDRGDPRSRDDAVAGQRARPGAATATEAWPEPPADRAAIEAPVDAVAWSAPEPVVARVEPPPRPPTSAAPAAERALPAFPYVLIGRLDDGRPQALLSGPLRSLAVAAGDVIDGQWRVDAVRDDGVTLTWLPGGQQQQLGFRAS